MNEVSSGMEILGSKKYAKTRAIGTTNIDTTKLQDLL